MLTRLAGTVPAHQHPSCIESPERWGEGESKVSTDQFQLRSPSTTLDRPLAEHCGACLHTSTHLRFAQTSTSIPNTYSEVIQTGKSYLFCVVCWVGIFWETWDCRERVLSRRELTTLQSSKQTLTAASRIAWAVITGTYPLRQHSSHDGARAWVTASAEVRSSQADIMWERVFPFSGSKRDSVVLAGLQTLNDLVIPSLPGERYIQSLSSQIRGGVPYPITFTSSHQTYKYSIPSRSGAQKPNPTDVSIFIQKTITPITEQLKYYVAQKNSDSLKSQTKANIVADVTFSFRLDVNIELQTECEF